MRKRVIALALGIMLALQSVPVDAAVQTADQETGNTEADSVPENVESEAVSGAEAESEVDTGSEAEEVTGSAEQGELESTTGSQNDKQSGNWEYFVVGKDGHALGYSLHPVGVEVTGYNGDEENVIIPDELDGYPVVCVDGFYNNKTIKSVTIPDTVSEIGESAFANCVNLESVTLPKSLRSIGTFAFTNTAIKRVEIKAANVGISLAAFTKKIDYYCDPDKQEHMEITIVGVPGSHVEEYAKSIEEYTFEPLSVIEENGVIYLPLNEDEAEVILYNGTNSKVQIPEKIGKYTVTQIAPYAFAKNNVITDLTISDRVTVVGQGAFEYCTALKTIKLPVGMKVMERYLFDGCKSLKSLEIPEGVEEVKECGLSTCVKLKKVTVPGSVKTFESGCFYKVKNIYVYDKEVDIPYWTVFWGEVYNHYGQYYCDAGKTTIYGYQDSKTYENFLNFFNNDEKYFGYEIEYSGTVSFYVLDGAEHTLEYDNKETDEDGELIQGKQTVPAGSIVMLTDKRPKKKGYNFQNWSAVQAYGFGDVTDEEGRKESYKEFVSRCFIMPDQDITISAEWQKIYKIKYVLNDGENHCENPFTYTDTDTTITLKDPVRQGFEFKGWYLDSNFTKKIDQIQQGSKGNLTIYAKWQGVTCHVIFKKNSKSATGNMNKIKFENGKTKKLPKNTYKRKGYTFVGWSNSSNIYYEYGDWFDDEEVVRDLLPDENNQVVLYAVWLKNTEKPVLKMTKKKQIQVSVKSNVRAEGYEIRYSTKSSMKTAKVKRSMEPKVTLKDVKKGQKYYVQVRTYMNGNKGRKYSAWSKKAAVRVK